MATILMTSQPARGHWNPLMRIAGELKERGHHVILSGPDTPEIRQYMKENGFDFRGIRPTLSAIGLLLVPLFKGFAETSFAARFFFAGIDYYARSLLAVIDEIHPDLIVSEFLFPASSCAAELRNIPSIVIYHAGLSFSGPGIPPFASGLPIHEDWGNEGEKYRRLVSKMVVMVDASIAKGRSRLGLDPAPKDFLVRPVSKWLTLVLTAQAMEAPRDPLPPNMFYIGPCFARSDGPTSGDFPFEWLSRDKPNVYVSLGTVFNRKPRVYRKIIEAFSDGRHRLIVSAGGAFDKLRKQAFSGDVHLFRQVPQTDVLPLVDVVISHGGNNTVNETLAAGRPLLVLPVGGEQGDNAAKVVFLHAGLRASIRNFTPQEIRGKTDRLLDEPRFSSKTREIASELAKTDGIATACRFMERIVETKEPVIRPAGYPETVTMDMQLPQHARSR